MKRKLLSILLILSLCLSFVPTGAAWAAEEEVIVGGVSLKSSGSPVYAITENGLVNTDKGNEYYYNIKWDGTTLTLRNAEINETYTDTHDNVYGISYTGSGGFTINLMGINRVTTAGNGEYIYSVYSYNSLSINGDGVLHVTAGDPTKTSSLGKSMSVGIYAQNLTINNGTINVQSGNCKGKSADSYAIYTGRNNGSRKLIINGGNVTATGGNVWCDADYGSGIGQKGYYKYRSAGISSGDVQINNGIVKATGGEAGLDQSVSSGNTAFYSYGIFGGTETQPDVGTGGTGRHDELIDDLSSGGVTITGGNVTATGGKAGKRSAGAGYSYGIFGNTRVSGEGTQVTASSGALEPYDTSFLQFNETVGIYGSVNISGGRIDVNNDNPMHACGIHVLASPGLKITGGEVTVQTNVSYFDSRVIYSEGEKVTVGEGLDAYTGKNEDECEKLTFTPDQDIYASIQDKDYFHTEKTPFSATLSVDGKTSVEKTYDGKPIPLTATAFGTTPGALIRNWDVYKKGELLKGYTVAANPYTFNDLIKNVSDTGTYYVQLTEGLKVADSNPVTVTINPATPTVSVTDKTASYTGQAIGADDCVAVTLVNDEQAEAEHISLTYYSDANCTQALSGAPTNVGTYYFKAHYAETDNYTAADSNVGTLTIEKGKSAIRLTAKNNDTETDTFTYGDIITIEGTVSNASMGFSNNLRSVAENQVALYYDNKMLANSAVDGSGHFTLSYDTTKQGIPTGSQQELTVKYGGSGTLREGEETITITLNKANQAAPEAGVGYTIDYVAETAQAASGYELEATNTVSSGEDSLNLTPGTDVYVRLKGDDFHNPSAWVAVDVPARPQAPAAPKIIAKSTDSLTIATEADTEYRIDNSGTWQKPSDESMTFSNLNPETKYTVYARKVAVAEQCFASEPASVQGTTLGSTGSGSVGDGETATLPDGATVANDDGTAVITKGGVTTTVKPVPEDGIKINDKGEIDAPARSVVQTGEGPAVTIGEKGASLSTTGTVTLTEEQSATCGLYTYTAAEEAVTIAPDGKAILPQNTTLQTAQGMTLTIGEGGAEADAKGVVTVPSGRSLKVKDTNGESSTFTMPQDGGTVAASDEGLLISGGVTAVTSAGKTIVLPASGGTLKPDGTLLYEVTVTFDSQGGSAVAQQVVIVGTTLTEPKRPSKGDNSFNGWYTDSKCTQRWDFQDPVLENMTLYAGWTPYTGKYSYEIFTDIGEHGTIAVERYATEGDEVTIRVSPDDTYLLEGLIVTSGSKNIDVKDNGDGTYTFTMPSGNVNIVATFAEDPDWTEPTTNVSEIFVDVDPDAWYIGAVQYAYDTGLMSGVSATEFAPNATTTRAMIVSMLSRMEDANAAPDAGFSDVASDAWYAESVNWAVANGIASGTGDNNFSPDVPITREQLAAMLMNYAAYKGEDVSARTSLENYIDAASVSSWANDAMSWAVAEGYISGMTLDELQPQGNATRAQVAAILQRFLAE